MVGGSDITLSGVVRGVDGTTSAPHAADDFVGFFHEPDEVIRYIVAHEAAHSCGLYHDVSFNSLMKQVKAGTTNLCHSFRHTGAPAGSTQELKTKDP